MAKERYMYSVYFQRTMTNAFTTASPRPTVSSLGTGDAPLTVMAENAAQAYKIAKKWADNNTSNFFTWGDCWYIARQSNGLVLG